jgi:hypothetical protein
LKITTSDFVGPIPEGGIWFVSTPGCESDLSGPAACRWKDARRVRREAHLRFSVEMSRSNKTASDRRSFRLGYRRHVRPERGMD